jgi:endoglucanase
MIVKALKKMNKNLIKKMLLAGVSFATFSMVGTTFAAEQGIHVDQVGYLTNHNKIAMITMNDVKKFQLVDTKNNKVVYEGTLSTARYDDMSDESIQVADFSNFNVPGTYKIVVDGKDSYEFKIGDNVYVVETVQNLRSYTLSRCNNPMTDSITGLEIKKGHPQDRKAILYFSDDLDKKGKIFDMGGGWYDAGDYGKYVTTGAFATAQLMLAYENNPKHFAQGQLFFPKGVKKVGKLPDVLAEVKYELDWMMKMQRRDGSTFHKVAGAQWPSFEISPDTDTQDRFIYSTCSAATAMYGAALAMGARIYKPYDAKYASTLLKKAELAWAYLERTPESVYRVDEGQESGSGPYNDTDDATERSWFAAEMFKTTGNKKYENYLKSSQAEVMKTKPSFFTWDNMLAFAQYSYVTSENTDDAFKSDVQAAFLSYADDIVKNISNDGFRCSLDESEYTWASTKNNLIKADILLMAYEILPNEDYVEGALDQIHYLFGRNALNRSFMTGAGANPPEHPHNRIHESTGAYVPGLIVGGPNFVSGGDPDQTQYLEENEVAPAKAYLDVLTSWSTNEYAIDYTSSAAYALSWFTKYDPKLTADQIKLKRVFPSITIK